MLEEDRNDGGEDVGNVVDEVEERGWSREWSNQMAQLDGTTPVAVLFLRVRYLNQALAAMEDVVADLRRVNTALGVSGVTILTDFLLSVGIRLLTLTCKSMTRERDAMRQEIRRRLVWEAKE